MNGTTHRCSPAASPKTGNIGLGLCLLAGGELGLRRRCYKCDISRMRKGSASMFDPCALVTHYLLGRRYPFWRLDRNRCHINGLDFTDAAAHGYERLGERDRTKLVPGSRFVMQPDHQMVAGPRCRN